MAIDNANKFGVEHLLYSVPNEFGPGVTFRVRPVHNPLPLPAVVAYRAKPLTQAAQG